MKSKEEWKVYGNVFSKHSFEILFNLSSQGYFEELESTISVGKEANIFSATTKHNDRIIAKIYRLENCNFSKMYEYLSNDPRYISVKHKTRLLVFSWVQREYKNLLIARTAIKVPKPIAFKDNILLMQFIGESDPAQMLKDAKLSNPKTMFKKILSNIKKLFDKGLIHADLSAFNILVDNDEPIFIDFSQSVPKTSDNAREFLKRDIKNICSFFRKYFEISDIEEMEIFNSIIKPTASTKSNTLKTPKKSSLL